MAQNIGSNLSYHSKRKLQKDEFDISKLFRIIVKRKWILVATVFVSIALAVLINYLSKPVFESKVLLKKEKTEKSTAKDELTQIISLQSADGIETELELVKTSDVLNKVIDELMLNVKVAKSNIGGYKKDYNKLLLEYNYYDKTSNSPAISFVKYKEPSGTLNLFLKKEADSLIKMYNTTTGQYLATAVKDNVQKIIIDNFEMHFDWKNANEGDKFYLTVGSINETKRDLNSKVDVEQKVKTDVFEVIVKSSSPYAAQKIAETITDKFRLTRIEQQKQTIRYSYDFVDQNLESVKKKLEEAESNLSNYKSSHKIMDIDGSSQNLVQFISNLEAEKMRTELELTDYTNKSGQMANELKDKGFFDQTFLSPKGNEPTNSPFSTLMSQQSDLELQRLDLLQKRKESHPDVVNIDKQIQQVKEKLNSYNKNTLTSYDIIINSLKEKESKINSLLGRYEGKMRSLPGQENELAGLLRQKNVYTKMYTLLLDKREEMRIAELSKLQDIVIVDPARMPLDPVAPKKVFNIAAGTMLGIFGGLIIMFLVEVMNKKQVNLDDLESDLDFPIFALIPSFTKALRDRIKNSTDLNDRFVMLMSDQDGFKESYRLLKTKLQRAFRSKSKIIMISSCEENTGKTTVVANLGISLAQSKNKVLLIDCDLKKSTLSTIFDIPEDAAGLISYLKKKVPQPFIYNKVDPNLDILPSGGISENSGDLLGTERMRSLINLLLTSDYDYIIIDTPPVLRVVDTIVLGQLISDVVLVLRPEHSYRDSVQWGIQEMNQEGMNVVGCIINAADIANSVFKNRYGYGYGYKYGNKLLEMKNAQNS